MDNEIQLFKLFTFTLIWKIILSDKLQNNCLLIISTINSNFFILQRYAATFDLGKSVHHHTIQINNQLVATVSQVYYLTFMCRSTCFGRLHAHHQDLTTALTASGFIVGALVVAALLVVVWQTTTNKAATTNAPTVKPEAVNAVVSS
jgi:hypothetical protein